MFRWKQQPLSALLPDLPDASLIEQDLSEAAADDVVFVTRIPDVGDVRTSDFAVRFQQANEEKPSVADRTNQQHDDDGDHIFNKVIQHNIDLQKLKTLRQNLDSELDSLEDSKKDLEVAVVGLDDLFQEVSRKTEDLKEARSFQRPK